MRPQPPRNFLRLRYLRELIAPKTLEWNLLQQGIDVVSRDHRKNIQRMYDVLFDYLERIPSYHVGEDEATEMMISRLKKAVRGTEVSLIVDLCSGFGRSTRLLSQVMGCRAIGIDLVTQQAAVARRRAANLAASFVVGDVRRPPLKANIFDVAWSEDAFSHIPRRDILLREVKGLIRPSGVLIFSDLIKSNRLTEKEEEEFCWAWCLAPLENLSSYRKKLCDAGFQLEQVEDIGQQVLAAHLRADNSRADAPPCEYRAWLQKNKRALIDEWGEEAFRVHLLRLRMYDYLSGGRLTHAFFIARAVEI